MSHPANYKKLTNAPIILSSLGIQANYPMAPLVTLKKDETILSIRAVLFIDSLITDETSISIEKLGVSNGTLTYRISYRSDLVNPTELFPWVIEHKYVILPGEQVDTFQMTLANYGGNEKKYSDHTFTSVSLDGATKDPINLTQYQAIYLFTDLKFTSDKPDLNVPIAYPIAPFVHLKVVNSILYIRAIAFIEAAIKTAPGWDLMGVENNVLSLDITYNSTNNSPDIFTAWMIEYQYDMSSSPIESVQTILWNTDPKTSRGTHTLVPDPKLPQLEDFDA